MNFNVNSNLWRRATRTAVSLTALTVCAFVANAQTAPTPPYASFQYSTLTGSGDTIVATWVPVVTTSGTVYKNIVLQFSFDADGNLILAPGYPQVSKAPAIIVSDFKAGTYVGPSTLFSGMAFINVSGPGVTTGGATEWSLSAASGANACTYPSSAIWYVGPIASSPYATRLKSAGITSTAWSYGVASAPCGGYPNWQSNVLIGVSQVGNTLTIASFSYGSTDFATPQAQIVYTFKP